MLALSTVIGGAGALAHHAETLERPASVRTRGDGVRSSLRRHRTVALAVAAAFTVLVGALFPFWDGSAGFVDETVQARVVPTVATAPVAPTASPLHTRAVGDLVEVRVADQTVTGPLLDASPAAMRFILEQLAGGVPPGSVAAAATGQPVGLAGADAAAAAVWVPPVIGTAAVLAVAIEALPHPTSLTVVVGGESTTLATRRTTVEDVLADFGFVLGEYDRLSHGFGDALTEGMEITVVLVEKVVEEYSQYTEPGTVIRDDHTLAPREERIIEGTPGEVRVFEEVTFENGVEVARAIQSSAVVSYPISSVLLRGPANRDGSPVVVDDYDGPYTQKLRMWSTWYNATHGGKLPDHPAYGITASGIPLRYGICAVDPDVIPLGTNLYVVGYGECLAADTGGAINGLDIDLGYPEGHAPNPWHTGYVYVYIID